MSQVQVYIADSRSMPEVADKSVGLIVTSPPYYAIKDYGVADQIGYGQSLHDYLRDLYRVWAECYRVLLPGGRLCINIGDQFARSTSFGRYKVIPLHAEIITQVEQLGLDYMGAIIWQKKTTMETSGGAVVMGSYPHPPNGVVELDYEFILLFKKRGRRSVPRELREAGRMTKEEWKTFFSGHWTFGGVRQRGHEAMFPEELPRRLIRMFSVPGDLVLDPFLGSGTTAQVAVSLGRDAVGYEINAEFLPLIKARFDSMAPDAELVITHLERSEDVPSVSYVPAILNLHPVEQRPSRRKRTLHKVGAILDPLCLQVEGEREVRLLGLKVTPEQAEASYAYLEAYVKGRQVYLKAPLAEAPEAAYVYLKNGLFVNRKMIEMGVAEPDDRPHPYRERFLKAMIKP